MFSLLSGTDLAAREKSDRLCPFYQRQLINEDVIVVDKLPQLGIGFVAIFLGPLRPNDRGRREGVDKQVWGPLAQVNKKTRPEVRLHWPLGDLVVCNRVAGYGKYSGENIHSGRPAPYRHTPNWAGCLDVADDRGNSFVRISYVPRTLHNGRATEDIFQLGHSVIGIHHRHARSLGDSRIRSEEHTSELQSPLNLVCRL